MTQEKRDIESRDDLIIMLRVFYEKVFNDPAINYIFIDVAKMDLEEHMPVITDFWEMVLFQKGTYQKNVMKVHLDLNDKTPLLKEHFNTWLTLFRDTVDELFSGQNAFVIKERALSIATLMQVKILQNPAKK